MLIECTHCLSLYRENSGHDCLDFEKPLSAIEKLRGFLREWFKEGQAPIHPGTLVNDGETFDEVVAAFVKEGKYDG